MAQSNGHFWVIVALEHSIEWLRAQYDAITTKYSLVEEHEIDDIGIFLFEQTE